MPSPKRAGSKSGSQRLLYERDGGTLVAMQSKAKKAGYTVTAIDSGHSFDYSQGVEMLSFEKLRQLKQCSAGA